MIFSPFWQQVTSQLTNSGYRRVLILSGERSWGQQLLIQLQQHLIGDWPSFSYTKVNFPHHYQPHNIHTLLGQEFIHGSFDCHQGFHAEALAILAGTLKAGSWLVLLVPYWQQWPSQLDEDSLRWNEQNQAISTPHFIAYLQTTLHYHPDILCWQQDEPCELTLLPSLPKWQRPTSVPTAEQQQVLDQLLTCDHAVTVLTAARGRGKSTLAAWFINTSAKHCWVTAPSKMAIASMQRHCQKKIAFFAPDQLLSLCQQEEHKLAQVDWLIIDEAAMIPVSLLTVLISYFPRVLLMTTVQGYEGTGQGFMLKFCQQLADYQLLSLIQPIRWASDDPLESWINRLFLFNDTPLTAKLLARQPIAAQIIDYQWPAMEKLRQYQLPLLSQIYQLLVQAHYRTTPVDWRRLLDASGITLGVAYLANQPVAALWLVEEGGLPTALAQAVWAGRRRPRGNLVAQSLAAHAGIAYAASLRSYRISRIAVDIAYRRQGIGQELVKQQLARLSLLESAVDYLSVSFAFQPELVNFWQACGLQIVRIGNRLDHVSGYYNAIALYPLSAAGRRLVRQLQWQFWRDSQLLSWHSQWQHCADFTYSSDMVNKMQLIRLNRYDWRNLTAFAFYLRSFSCSLPALYRFINHLPKPLSHNLLSLKAHICEELTLSQAAQITGVAGKKALIAQWRKEIAQQMNLFNVNDLHHPITHYYHDVGEDPV